MIFTNFSFFLFFIIFVCIYSFIDAKVQKYVLFIGNLLFCYFAGFPSFLVALSVVLFTYLFGLLKKTWVVIGVLLNIGLLIYFKYFSSFYPVGISFYTFTCVAYLVDVITKKTAPEKNILDFSNFILFFPKFISGPVERTGTLLPQLKNNERKIITFENLQVGFHLFLFGFFKKICIANRLQIYVDKVFDNLPQFGGLSYIIALAFYSIQIYCDFSGYTDMALGVAKVFGFDLIQNFKNPYSAISVSDFWHKWHISLSSWLRDYIYIPLGGNRKGNLRKYLNVLITFFISGIWHGNTLNFCIWGGVHGCFQIIEGISKNKISKINTKIRNLFTIVVIAFSWIFFRLNTVKDIPAFFNNLFSKKYMNFLSMKKALCGINFSTFNNMTPYTIMNLNVFISIIVLLIVSKIEVSKGKHISEIIVNEKKIIRYSFDYVLIILIFTIGVFDSTRFIYAAF